MRLFRVTKDYLKEIQKISLFIPQQEEVLGTVLRINGYIYFLPINNEDSSDYESDGTIKKSSPFVLRMTSSDNKKSLGKCMLSNMFPVPYNELLSFDFAVISENLISLFNKKIEYLKKNKSRIEKSAQRIYKQKIKGYKQPYLNRTVDFYAAEKFCTDYEMEHYGKHYNRFPDDEYFISNPFTNGITEYYLMNKTTKISKITLNNENNTVVDIVEIYNPDYAPLECFKEKQLNVNCITSWFRDRGIPSWRDGLDDFLDNVGIKNKDILLNKAFGLSLSDQYWLNPVEKQMDWHDINFFMNDFNSQDFIDASFENKILIKDNINLYTPNNTSDGMLKKTWVVESDKKRYLLKSSLRQMDLEPFCEVLASDICKVINLDHVDYTIDQIGHKIMSKCECFIDINTEYISSFSILRFENVDLNAERGTSVYKYYIKILEEKGIKNVKEKLLKMFILDYLIVNKDRHLGNFGVVRDVNSLQWLDIAPIFDSGQAMYSQSKIYEYNFHTASGTFFNQKDIDFDYILNTVSQNQNIEINYDELYEVAIKWRNMLYRYDYLTAMGEDKIEALYYGLIQRIEKLKEVL